MSIINTNLSSMNAQRNLKTSQNDLNTSIQRLSSGLRVNSAKDDAAGLSIATKMDSQIRGMSQAIRNANDGISMIQTADSGLATAAEAIQRMRELAVQGANASNGSDEYTNLSKEFTELKAEVARIGTDTTFNGKKILGTDAAAMTFQVGADGTQTIGITFTALAAVTGTVDNQTNSTAAIATLDAALKDITSQRATLGAGQNRMSSAITNLQSSVENQTAAKSRIMDTDFASETAKLTRAQILQQAGTAMLAQANQAPNGVMALLRG
jgi:flagellin